MANGCFETEVERQLVAVVSLLQCAESQVERRDAKVCRNCSIEVSEDF